MRGARRYGHGGPEVVLRARGAGRRSQFLLQLYAFVANSPVNAVDPEGLDQVWVCWRPLSKRWPLRRWRHTFIKIHTDSDGLDHTWGILGDPGQTTNQRPWKDESGTPKDPRNSTKNGGECILVPGYVTTCQIESLKKGLDAARDSGTCGPNYKNKWWRADYYNSNTFVYNMLTGAGMTPPAISRAPGYRKAPRAVVLNGRRSCWRNAD